MLAPLSWLKEYIDITLDPKELGERLTEIGLGCEKIHKTKNDIIFELEITPNRPDCLSIIGVTREIAAIENKEIKYPNLKTDLKPKNINSLSIKIHPNFNCSERMTGIIIDNISVKESPQWLKDRLSSIGQRPINNIVDITNFVMYELGNPIHSFDFNKIENHEMWVRQAKGREKFESVDEISYKLPKEAIIYEDTKKIFDLAGIKGGRNSGTYNDTKTVFILVAVDNPILIRKASQALSLRSDASAIFERAVDKNGTINALKRTVDLILETAGGEIASKLIDIKEKEFNPWKLQMRLDRLEFILGIKIPEERVVNILSRLNLSPAIKERPHVVECTIPSYRNDLKIEEDLIEEVARLYGYNNFPKTMLVGETPKKTIPYFKDYRLFDKAKFIMAASGFSEVYTYSLIPEDERVSLRIDNPVSREFEYLRPNLKNNLTKALKDNLANFKDVNLFELGKVYLGKSINKVEEPYYLGGISNTKSYLEIKGIIDELGEKFNINLDPSDYIEILDEGIFFEINFSDMFLKMGQPKAFIPIPKYPSITEDISFIFNENIKLGEIINAIKKQSNLIADVSLLDQFEDSKTFHIIYQDPTKNLTNEIVSKIRTKIIKNVEKKFGARVK